MVWNDTQVCEHYRDEVEENIGNQRLLKIDNRVQ
jgi:hypothetical protein